MASIGSITFSSAALGWGEMPVILQSEASRGAWGTVSLSPTSLDFIRMQQRYSTLEDVGNLLTGIVAPVCQRLGGIFHECIYILLLNTVVGKMGLVVLACVMQ